MYFTEKKIAKHLDEIKSTIHREKITIPSFKMMEVEKEGQPLAEAQGAHLPDFDDSAWHDFKLGETWGGYDVVAWFRASVNVPEAWMNRKCALRFLVGPRDGGHSTAETLLYVNGVPIQGIDVWHEDAWLPPEHLQTGQITVALKAWSGVLGVPDRRRFKEAELIWIDEGAEQFYYIADTLLKAVKELDENDLRRTQMLDTLNRAFLEVDFYQPRSEAYYQSLQQAVGHLKRQLEEWAAKDETKPTVTGVGHSHIDMAWLWRLSHTREKASRTFSTVLHLMRQYPEYRFIHTSPQLYKYLKEDYPEIFAKVKEKIRSGEWEITGGMWIEPDTNVPSGESLIRQILLGKRFMKEEFGVDTNVVWLPDVFGYTWSLPQIIERSGITRFMTTKISWSQYNRFPHDTFHWRGLDGTELFTHFITTPEFGSLHYTYNGEIDPLSVKGIWNHYRQKDVNDELLMAFGWGDGGGGPTKEQLEAGRVLENLPGLPKFQTGTVEPYFDRLEKRLKDKSLPVWDGELYLEFHRGTYTSQGWLKRANRKAEILYHHAEWLSALSDLLTETKHYPEQALEEGWERLLLNQFHDILPGSSIRQVYEDAREDFRHIEQIGREAMVQAATRLEDNIQSVEDGVIVYNPLSWQGGGLLELPNSEEWSGQTVRLADGMAADVQETKDADGTKWLVHVDDVPALGYRHLARTDRSASPALNPISVKKDRMSNDYYELQFNEHGQLSSVFDKRHGREVLAEGQPGNVLQTFEDKPMAFDAWDIDLYYQEKMKIIDSLVSAEVEEEGPLRGTLKLTWQFYDSVITQRISIYRNSPRIDFRTEVDWQEKQVLLKTAFPVSIRSTKATYDIQFGNIERATHWNTSWDYAKFEVCAHKWADLSEGNYGVSLLNDCKYGYDIKDHVMRLTLIKSSVRPDETADRGKHVFTYSLLPHMGTWREGGTVQEAYALNMPATARLHKANPTGILPAVYGLATVDADHVILETVKKAERADEMVIRAYEYKHCRNDHVTITFGSEVEQVVACNLMEEEEEVLPVSGRTVTFPIKPYEIKTVKVRFKL